MDETGQEDAQLVKRDGITSTGHRFKLHQRTSNTPNFYEKLMFFENGQHGDRKAGGASSLPVRTVSFRPPGTEHWRKVTKSHGQIMFEKNNGLSEGLLHRGSDPNIANGKYSNFLPVRSFLSVKDKRTGFPQDTFCERGIASENQKIYEVPRKTVRSTNASVTKPRNKQLSGFSHKHVPIHNTNGQSLNDSFLEPFEKVHSRGYSLLAVNELGLSSLNNSMASSRDLSPSEISEFRNLNRLKPSQSNSAPNLLLYCDDLKNEMPQDNKTLTSLPIQERTGGANSTSSTSYNKENLDVTTIRSNVDQFSYNSSVESLLNTEVTLAAVPVNNLCDTGKVRSTANMRLAQSPNVLSGHGGDNNHRKIRVIKSAANYQRGGRHSISGNRSSPRLDEWLRSVMKVQREMASQNTNCWPFPEDESAGNNDMSTTCYQEPQTYWPWSSKEKSSEYLSDSRRLSSPLPCKALNEYNLEYMKRPRSSPVPELSERYVLPDNITHKVNSSRSEIKYVDQQSHASVELCEKHPINMDRSTEQNSCVSDTCLITDPIHSVQRRLENMAREDQYKLQRCWSTTGINTDITVPVKDKTVRPLCGFCNNCQSTNRALECASAKVHGICCACRHAVDQACHVPLAKSSCEISERPKTVSRTPMCESAQTSSDISSSCIDNHNRTGLTSFIKNEDNKCLNNGITSKTRRPSKDLLGSDASHSAVGITIRITGEEERDSEDNIRRTPSAFRAVRETPKSLTTKFDSPTSSAGKNVDQSPTTSGSLTRGTSPHYMFPSSANTCDEEFLLRHPMSPRNSVGSISSILSYKSSNADSAVDLGPPDDDHEHDHDHNDDQEFAFDEFLAKQQDKHEAGLYQMPESSSFVPCMGIFPTSASSLSSFTTTARPELHSTQPSPPVQITKCYLSLSSSLPNSTSSTPVPDNNQDNEQSSQKPIRTHAFHYTGKLSKCDSIPKELDFWSKKDASQVVIDNKDSKTISLPEENTITQAQHIQEGQQRQRYLFEDAASASGRPQVKISSTFVDEKHLFKPLQLEHVEDDCDKSIVQPLRDRRDLGQPCRNSSPNQQLPALIISDHSSDHVTGIPSPTGTQSPFSLNFSVEDASTSSDNESSLNSHPPSPNLSVSSGAFTPTFGDLLQVRGHAGISRTSSVSSISSEGSTCSTCSYVSDSGRRPKKVRLCVVLYCLIG